MNQDMNSPPSSSPAETYEQFYTNAFRGHWLDCH